MSKRHLDAFERIAAAIDVAAVGRHHRADRAKEILAHELTALRDQWHALATAEVVAVDALTATRAELAKVTAERDQAHADIERLSRGLFGLPLESDAPSVREWN